MNRFTISLQDELADQFDQWIARRGYENRSEAVRDMLRAELQEERLRVGQSAQCVASLSYVYRYGERELVERLARLQHDHHDLVVSTMHIQLDHDYRLETVMLRGMTVAIMALADAICAERGVHHGKMNVVSVVEHAHDHEHPHLHPDAHPHAHPHLHAHDASDPQRVTGHHVHLKPAH